MRSRIPEDRRAQRDCRSNSPTPSGDTDESFHHVDHSIIREGYDKFCSFGGIRHGVNNPSRLVRDDYRGYPDPPPHPSAVRDMFGKAHTSPMNPHSTSIHRSWMHSIPGEVRFDMGFGPSIEEEDMYDPMTTAHSSRKSSAPEQAGPQRIPGGRFGAVPMGNVSSHPLNPPHSPYVPTNMFDQPFHLRSIQMVKAQLTLPSAAVEETPTISNPQFAHQHLRRLPATETPTFQAPCPSHLPLPDQNPSQRQNHTLPTHHPQFDPPSPQPNNASPASTLSTTPVSKHQSSTSQQFAPATSPTFNNPIASASAPATQASWRTSQPSARTSGEKREMASRHVGLKLRLSGTCGICTAGARLWLGDLILKVWCLNSRVVRMIGVSESVRSEWTGLDLGEDWVVGIGEAAKKLYSYWRDRRAWSECVDVVRMLRDLENEDGSVISFENA